MGSAPAGERGRRCRACPRRDGDAATITWASATVTAFSARTRMPAELGVALLGGQVDDPEDGAVVLPVGEEALGHRAAPSSQLASSDQSPPTSSASCAAWSTMPSASTRMACSTLPKYW